MFFNWYGKKSSSEQRKIIEYNIKMWPSLEQVRLLEAVWYKGIIEVEIVKGTKFGRRVKEDDNPYDDHSHANNTFGWYTIEPIESKPTFVTDDDSLRNCLDPYQGITKYSDLNKSVKLINMSQKDTIEEIKKKLNKEVLNVLQKAFQVVNDTVYRLSEFENDKQLCSILLDNHVFHGYDGWYCPTIQKINEEGVIAGLHRREVLLLNPESLFVSDENLSATASPSNAYSPGQPAGPTRRSRADPLSPQEIARNPQNMNPNDAGSLAIKPDTSSRFSESDERPSKRASLAQKLSFS